MVKTILSGIGVLLLARVVCAEPAAFWRFEDGNAGKLAGAVASEMNVSALAAKAGAFEGGVPPAYEEDVPFKELWDSVAEQPAATGNRLSLRFRTPDSAKGAAPVGGEVVVSGKEPAAKPESFTVEAFVKMAKQQDARHALIASKRRKGNTGASWSLSVTPSGALGVRFDTEQENDGIKSGAFNQCFSGSRVPDDGAWHHVALTMDHETLKASLFVDYQPCGGGTVAAPLVYDDSNLVIGRGLDGWLDEVRLSAAVLHPEQFLRPTRFFTDMQKKKQDSYPTFLDQTFTRVQSALDPELTRIGTLIPKNVHEIETPMWSLGCETLDRDLADWDAYRGYLVPLGIKRIRLQGGWGRTEKKKGEYDFGWLDHIVDDAISLGLEVCLETSYGNRLYEKNAAGGPGGLLPAGEDTLAAWDRWVEAMARRYSAKGVKEWMMYNEPNLRKENTAALIVTNNIRTAEIIKRVDPEAKIGAFVLAGLNLDMMKVMLTQIKEQGKLGLFHWAIYHGYSGNPDRLNERMDDFQAMLADVAPSIKPWQGEAGCASEEVQFALSGIPWTEYSHAKWNTRRMLCDLGHDVESSVFTIADLAYHKDFISRYGLLKTSPDNGIIKVKSAYYSVQNVVTVFNDALARVPDYALAVTAGETNLTWFAFRDKKSGLDAVALWDGREIPNNDSDLERVDLVIKGGLFKEPVWVDLITGHIYDIPAEQVTAEGTTITFKNIPVYDGPAVITDKSLLSFVPAREKKKSAKAKPATKTAKASEPKITKHLLPGTQQPAPGVLILTSKGDAAGTALARWLNEQEVHAFVLPIEVGLSPDAALQDVRQALIYIRNRSAEWQVKGDAVGVIGMQTNGVLAQRVTGKEADFGVVIDCDVQETVKASAGTKRLFVGNRDAWKTPLAKWLEPFKVKVF